MGTAPNQCAWRRTSRRRQRHLSAPLAAVCTGMARVPALSDPCAHPPAAAAAATAACRSGTGPLHGLLHMEHVVPPAPRRRACQSIISRDTGAAHGSRGARARALPCVWERLSLAARGCQCRGRSTTPTARRVRGGDGVDAAHAGYQPGHGWRHRCGRLVAHRPVGAVGTWAGA